MWIWFRQPQSSPSFSRGPQHPEGPWSTPTSHSYRIPNACAELLVLCRQWIQEALAEASVGDEEGERVQLEVQPGSWGGKAGLVGEQSQH